MRRLSKESWRRGSKGSGVGHVNDAKFASLCEEADERQPGKTLRILSSSKLVGVNQKLQKTFVCSKCGKGFQSSKALCGHMACHSVKEKALRRNKQLMIMDSQSDTESGSKNLRRRSRRGKCKKFDDPVTDSMSKLDGYSNCSSEASGVEQEQAEEVAISLMMLSRDSGNWGGLNSIGDSSENNSVVLEARSISPNLMKKDCLRTLESDVDEAMMKFGGKKIETLGDLECGHVHNGATNVVTDVKFDNLRKNKRDKGPKAEQHSSLRKFKSTEKPKMELYSRLSAENGSYSVMNQYSKLEMFRSFEHRARIRSQFHQVFNDNLAGHHKSFKAPSPSTPESGKNSLETDGSPGSSKGKSIVHHLSNNAGAYQKMGNKHECPICFNVFRSVQALGGHRRVHSSERSGINNCDEKSPVFKRNGTQLHDFIDLNLPAPMED